MTHHRLMGGRGRWLLREPVAPVEAERALVVYQSTFILKKSTKIKYTGMVYPYLGEIMMVPYTFAPEGWAFCNGQLMPIANNQALYSLLGTKYGGDGRTTFSIPDLRGRVPMHAGQGPGTRLHRLGETGGRESVMLDVTQMPAHTHPISITEAQLEAYQGGRGETADATSPDGNVLGNTSDKTYYEGKTPNTTLESDALNVRAQAGQAGRSQPHTNMQPYTALHFVISLRGTYPSHK